MNEVERQVIQERVEKDNLLTKLRKEKFEEYAKAQNVIQQLRQELDELKQARHEREEWKERLRKGNRVVHRNKEHYRKLSERLQKERDEWKGMYKRQASIFDIAIQQKDEWKEKAERYRKALEYYADEENYEARNATDTDDIFDPFRLIDFDEGKTAKKALEGDE